MFILGVESFKYSSVTELMSEESKVVDCVDNLTVDGIFVFVWFGNKEINTSNLNKLACQWVCGPKLGHTQCCMRCNPFGASQPKSHP